MTQGLPCINPTCDYTFSMGEVRGASALSCPRCGNVFQLGSGPAPAAPALPVAVPVASRVAAPAPEQQYSSSPPKAGPWRAVPQAPIPRAEPVLPDLRLELDPPRNAPPRTESNTAALSPQPSFLSEPPPASVPSVTVTATPLTGSAPVAERVGPAAADDFLTESTTFSETGPAFGEDEPSPFAEDTPLSTATLERRRQPGLAPWKKVVLGVALGSLFIGLPLMAAIFGFFSATVGSRDWQEAFGYNGFLFNQNGQRELAFCLGVPFDVWKEREEFKIRLKAAVALEREFLDPETQNMAVVVLAVAGQDYGKQRPRDAELIKQAIAKLENCFGENVVVESTPEETRLDGKRALALYYQARTNSAEWLGTCYALTHHGFGYWVFVMQTIPVGVDQELADKLFAQMQGQKKMGFHVVTDRRTWTERPPDLDTYVGESNVIKISVPKDQWQWFSSRDLDSNGELYLHSKAKKKFHLEHEKEAAILVVKVPKNAANPAEAVEDALNYVQARKTEENPAFVVSLIDPAAKEKAQPKKIGNLTGRLLELRMDSDDKNYKKYILLAVVPRADHYYLIQCESFWHYRQAWRGDFFDILDTFTLKE